MRMMDLYSLEEAREAIEDSIEMRKKFVEEIETLDILIFMLKYYVATGEPLDPTAFGIEDEPEEDLND